MKKYNSYPINGIRVQKRRNKKSKIRAYLRDYWGGWGYARYIKRHPNEKGHTQFY